MSDTELSVDVGEEQIKVEEPKDSLRFSPTTDRVSRETISSQESCGMEDSGKENVSTAQIIMNASGNNHKSNSLIHGDEPQNVDDTIPSDLVVDESHRDLAAVEEKKLYSELPNASQPIPGTAQNIQLSPNKLFPVDGIIKDDPTSIKASRHSTCDIDSSIPDDEVTQTRCTNGSKENTVVRISPKHISSMGSGVMLSPARQHNVSFHEVETSQRYLISPPRLTNPPTLTPNIDEQRQALIFSPSDDTLESTLSDSFEYNFETSVIKAHLGSSHAGTPCRLDYRDRANPPQNDLVASPEYRLNDHKTDDDDIGIPFSITIVRSNDNTNEGDLEGLTHDRSQASQMNTQIRREDDYLVPLSPFSPSTIRVNNDSHKGISSRTDTREVNLAVEDEGNTADDNERMAHQCMTLIDSLVLTSSNTNRSDDDDEGIIITKAKPSQAEVVTTTNSPRSLIMTNHISYARSDSEDPHDSPESDTKGHVSPTTRHFITTAVSVEISNDEHDELQCQEQLRAECDSISSTMLHSDEPESLSQKSDCIAEGHDNDVSSHENGDSESSEEVTNTRQNSKAIISIEDTDMQLLSMGPELDGEPNFIHLQDFTQMEFVLENGFVIRLDDSLISSILLPLDQLKYPSQRTRLEDLNRDKPEHESPHEYGGRKSPMNTDISNLAEEKEMADTPISSPNSALFQASGHKKQSSSTREQQKYRKKQESSLVDARGSTYARLSLKSLITRKWREIHWLRYEKTSLIVFRSKGDADYWLGHPHEDHRDILIKLQINFRQDLRSGNCSYKLTELKTKQYEKTVDPMFQFKLERWTDLGGQYVAAFASPSKDDISNLQDAIQECLQLSVV